MINRVFHYLSYLRFVMYMWGSYIAFPELFNQSENIISNIGFGLFLFGIGLSLEGFKKSDDFTKMEIKRFANPKLTKRVLLISFLMYCFAILTGVLFFNVGNIYSNASSEFISKFKELGYGSLALGIGGITIVKEQYNRLNAFLKEKSKEIDVSKSN